jgi:ankyrin repeat protein
VEIINILLGKGMSIDLRNGYDWTPLHYSAKYGNLEATKALAKTGSALNKINKRGNTPLLLTATFGKLDVFR